MIFGYCCKKKEMQKGGSTPITYFVFSFINRLLKKENVTKNEDNKKSFVEEN